MAKQLIIYQLPGGNFTLRPTRREVNGRNVIFVITGNGKALSKHTNDAELGRWVRRILEKCA